MITITPAAAEQIRASADQGGMQDMAMRIAAKRNPDGSIHYGMGFDDNEHEGDVHVTSEGINVIIAETSKILLDGMTLDYVEVEPESFQFIFLNPNDVHYIPPER